MNTIAADRAVERTFDLSECIEVHEQAIASAVDAMVDDLRERGVLRVHRQWSASEELKLIREAATRAAIKAVLGSDWADLPAEVKWLHLDRTEAA